MICTLWQDSDLQRCCCLQPLGLWAYADSQPDRTAGGEDYGSLPDGTGGVFGDHMQAWGWSDLSPYDNRGNMFEDFIEFLVSLFGGGQKTGRPSRLIRILTCMVRAI